jgi:hypothetical protein
MGFNSGFKELNLTAMHFVERMIYNTVKLALAV